MSDIECPCLEKGNCPIEERLTQCRAEIDEKVEKMTTDIDTLQEMQADIKEMLEIFRASKGAIKVMAWTGRGIRWIAFTVAAVVALYAILKGIDNG